MPFVPVAVIQATRRLRVVCALTAALVGLLLLTSNLPAKAAGSARARIVVRDADTRDELPCRVHLKDESGRTVKAPGLPFWHDHFVCPGRVELDVEPGTYRYEVEHGPEFTLAKGEFTVAEGEAKDVEVRLKRLANLAAEGWWSGDLHVHRPVAEIELLLRAEDLHMAPVITWWNDTNAWSDREPPAEPVLRFDGNRFTQVMAGEDEREGGALLYFHLKRPLPISGARREFPSPLAFVAEARKHRGVWIDVEKPFWWDMPTWVAAGQVDSIGLANNHMARDRMFPGEAWGRPRDQARLPAPLGNGFYTQEVYYHLLNCGLRIPPSAGSASGVLPNPVGYNRVYVHTDGDLSYDAWWDALRAGRSFVTNGPLLRVRANGHDPGHVFAAEPGQGVEISLDARLDARDPLARIEVITNGQVTRTITPEQWAETRSLGSLRFDRSGWFLVRVLADNPRTFRFASTAPFYVEVGPNTRRISRSSAQFFLDWVRQREARVKLDNPTERESVLAHHHKAETFWDGLLKRANAD